MHSDTLARTFGPAVRLIEHRAECDGGLDRLRLLPDGPYGYCVKKSGRRLSRANHDRFEGVRSCGGGVDATVLAWYALPMSLAELQQEVEALSPAELDAFTSWLDNMTARRGDERFELDVLAGKLDALGQRADLDFELGKCCEL